MRVFVGLLLALAPLFGDGIPHDEYRTRRAELKKSLDGVMVLFGANESDDLRTPYLQETNFLYLSGWKEPGAVMMLTKNEEILFLPERNRHTETFYGHRLAAGDADATEKSGFDKVMPSSAIESEFTRLLANSQHVYALAGDPNAEKLKALAPFHGDLGPAQTLIAALARDQIARRNRIAHQSRRCDRRRASGGMEDDQARRLRISNRGGHARRLF